MTVDHVRFTDPAYDALVQFRVLGPVDVVAVDRRLEFGSERRRAILAVLLAARDQVVSAGRLGQAVWGPQPPPSVDVTMRSHVSRLRKVLAEHSPGGAEAVVTEPDGYRLVVRDGDVDADRFEGLVAQARRIGQTDAAGAVALWEEAEGLWRGPAFGGLAEYGIVRAEAVRLEELRAAAGAERVEAQLALGRHEAVIGELEARVAAAPLGERAYGQLMVALYRSGRQADALAVYHRLRERLGEELGVDPSPEVRAVHERVLRQDPALAPPHRASRGRFRPERGQGGTGPDPSVPAGPLAPLFGRDEDVAWVCGLVGDARLVTLTGPGGVGKTRLAERVGEVTAERFDDGVVMIRLASVPDPGSVGAALVGALHVPQQDGRSVEETLVAAVGTRRMLVVLDCCEHVLGPVATLVTSLLHGCPNVGVLATSREPLRLPGERVWRVPPLRVPATGAGAPEVAESPAGALFCARAAAAEPSFTLTDNNATVVAELCRRLDGVPLALELAAARVRAMTAADLLARLSDRFALLTGGPAHEGGRHRTLEAVVAWSHDLLNEREARLFQRLSVFAGAFTLEAAEQVCAGDGLAASEVAGVLAELVDKSMVTVERTDEAVRYRLLDTLRAYGAARLAEAGAADAAHDAHAAYHLGLAEERDAQILGPDGKAALAAIDGAFDDLRLAHEWLVDNGDVDGALRLSAALGTYLVLRLRLEIGRWIERALVLPGATEHALHPLALAISARADGLRGDVEQARFKARAVLAREDDDLAAWYAITTFGAMAMLTGRLDDLIALEDRTAAVAEALGEDRRRAVIHGQRVVAYLSAGDHQRARDEAAKVEAITRDATSPVLKTLEHQSLGAALASTDPSEAAHRLEAAVALARDVGVPLTAGGVLVLLATLRSREGEIERSLALFHEAIIYWRRLGGGQQQAEALHSLVETLTQVRVDEAAARLYGAVNAPALGAGSDAAADQLAAAWDELIERMGSDAAETAASKGRRLSIAEAADEALAVLDELLDQ